MNTNLFEQSKRTGFQLQTERQYLSGIMPEEENTMTVFVIPGEADTAYRSIPNLLSEGDIVIGSAEDIAASGLSLARLVAIWNALPSTTAISKLQDWKRAVQRLRAA